MSLRLSEAALGEVRSMMRLAVPVVMAEIGWFAMSLVDTVMVGPLGPAAIGAVSTNNILFMTLIVFGFGTLSRNPTRRVGSHDCAGLAAIGTVQR